MLFIACCLFTVADFFYLTCNRVYSYCEDTFTTQSVVGGAYVD